MTVFEGVKFTERYLCVFCFKSYRRIKWLAKHEKNHKQIFTVKPLMAYLRKG